MGSPLCRSLRGGGESQDRLQWTCRARARDAGKANSYQTNTVVVNGTALVAAGHPHARAALERRGLCVIALGLSEIAKADGSLICMSILLD